MKKMIALCAAMMLALCCTVAALAEDKLAVAVQYEGQFRIRATTVASDGTFVLVGVNPPGLESMPHIMRVNTAGEVLWNQTKKNTIDGTNYSDVAQIKDGPLAVLRSIRVKTGSNYVVEMIEGQKVVARSKEMPSVFGFAPIDTGVLVYSVPDYNTPTSRITKIDTTGKVRAAVNWKERLEWEGMLTRDDLYVAYGYKVGAPEAEDLKLSAVALALDPRGKTLWRYDGAEQERYTGAAWTESGGVALIGRTEKQGFIMALDPSQQVAWRIDLDGTQAPITDGEKMSILPVGGNLLIAAADSIIPTSGNSQPAFQVALMLVAPDGTILREWTEPTGDMNWTFFVSLHSVDERVYLLMHGITTSKSDNEARYEEPTRVLLKELSL